METVLHNENYKKDFIPYTFAALMIGLSGGFTAVLGPAFVADQGIDYNNTTWIALSLAISTAVGAPILGKLGDVYGRRKTLLTGIFVFTLGNILTALANSLGFMLLARFTVGLGTAAIAPIIMSFIVTDYPPEEMGKGFSTYMLVSSAAVVAGPTIGGIIMNASGWRAMMWVVSALCCLVFMLCWAMIGKTDLEKKTLADFDRAGALLVAIFFSLFLCMPSFGQNFGWASPAFIMSLVVGLVALTLLVVTEKKALKPILNGEFIARKEFILPVLILFLTQGLMQANMTNVIVFIRYTQPTNVIISSFAISIMYVGMSLGAVIIGPLADKKEPRAILTGSLVLTGIGCGLMYFFSSETTVALFAASLGILGFGLGGNATIFMKVALKGLNHNTAGSGTGTYNLFRDISAPFGVAVFVPLFTNGIAERIGTLTSSGIGQQDAVIKAAVESIRSLALIEISCVLAAMVIVRKLPKIHGASQSKA